VVPWSKEGWYIWGGLCSVPAFFVIGLIFMLAYYRFCHPTGAMPNKSQKSSLF
jgi:hypothetical protein